MTDATSPTAPSLTADGSLTAAAPALHASSPRPAVYYLAAAGLAAASFALARSPTGAPRFNVAAFLSCAAAMASLFAGAGSSLCGRRTGVLIMNRNLMSLARLQTALWTLVVLGGFATLAFVRLKTLGPSSALDIRVDWHLWALMGISTGSLVGSPLLLEAKSSKTPANSAMARTAQLTGETASEVDRNRHGSLYSNATPLDARFEDMFTGDEVGNTAHIDLAKLQMFLFTVVTALTYCASVVALFSQSTGAIPSALPDVSDGFVAMFGISHAGYLTSKSVDHTPTVAGG
ncbi:MAG TPA: hypothetical protein VMK12_05465 [Anaeromyxobacteraceae bacterium]|nr:hypothetical protein [Anaeromyxobacteraceae bacterium]